MKRKIEIKYEWWDGSGEPHTDHDHQDELEEAAHDRIFEQVNAGMRAGELYATIMDDDQEYNYQGWWDFSEVVVGGE